MSFFLAFGGSHSNATVIFNTESLITSQIPSEKASQVASEPASQ